MPGVTGMLQAHYRHAMVLHHCCYMLLANTTMLQVKCSGRRSATQSRWLVAALWESPV
jgi:hypothetical protein